jgi:hypothetical protein
MDAFSLLTGVGKLYIAPLGTAFPAVTATPGASWRDLGDTQDGVDMNSDDKIELVRTDQRTGPVKATRTDETIVVKTKLAEATFENLADAMGVSVTDTPAGSGTIGTRAMPLHRGAHVSEFAFLFRGDSPYGSYPAQYELPRAFCDEVGALKYEKGKNMPIPITFKCLEDLNAATESERYGRLVAQDAAALP